MRSGVRCWRARCRSRRVERRAGRCSCRAIHRMADGSRPAARVDAGFGCAGKQRRWRGGGLNADARHCVPGSLRCSRPEAGARTRPCGPQTARARPRCAGQPRSAALLGVAEAPPPRQRRCLPESPRNARDLKSPRCDRSGRADRQQHTRRRIRPDPARPIARASASMPLEPLRGARPAARVRSRGAQGSWPARAARTVI